jgi:hypothetical protein
MYALFLAATGALDLLFVACAVLPLTVYARVERRSRRAWTTVGVPAPRLGRGPYRSTEGTAGRLARAPALVRVAGVACFYWAWLGLMGWMALAVAMRDRPAFELLALVGVGTAVLTWRTGGALLRRTPGAVRFGRRVAGWTAAHAALVLALALVLGGAEWGGPAALFLGVSFGQAALVVATVRRHADLYGLDPRAELDRQRLPAWLALALSRRRLATRTRATLPG